MARSDREGSLGCVRASYRQAMEKVNAEGREAGLGRGLSMRPAKIGWNEGTRRAGYVGGAPFEYFSSRNEKYFATPGDSGI